MNYLPFKIFHPKLLFNENIHSFNNPLNTQRRHYFAILQIRKLNLWGGIRTFACKSQRLNSNENLLEDITEFQRWRIKSKWLYISKCFLSRLDLLSFLPFTFLASFLLSLYIHLKFYENVIISLRLICYCNCWFIVDESTDIL